MAEVNCGSRSQRWITHTNAFIIPVMMRKLNPIIFFLLFIHLSRCKEILMPAWVKSQGLWTSKQANKCCKLNSWTAGYLQSVEEFNLGPADTKFIQKDLKLETPDYKFSDLTATSHRLHISQLLTDINVIPTVSVGMTSLLHKRNNCLQNSASKN